MNRQENNLLLLNRLYEIVLSEPDSRFGQILTNYGFVAVVKDENHMVVSWKNEFFTEPNKIVDRVEKEIERLKV